MIENNIIELATIYRKEVNESIERFKTEFKGIIKRFSEGFKKKTGRNPTPGEIHSFTEECKSKRAPKEQTRNTGRGIKGIDEEAVRKIQKVIRGHNVRKNNKLVFCFSCGGMFDASKIQQHQGGEACVRNMDQMRSELPRVLRGTAPVPPEESIPAEGATADEFVAYNEIAREAFRASLPTCPCGKRLELEVMAVHLTKCTQWKDGNAAGGGGRGSVTDLGMVMKMQSVIRGHNVRKNHQLVFCYSCGDMFDISKIRQHQSADRCVRAMGELRRELPKVLRGTVPVVPAESIPSEGADVADFTAYNETAREAFRASLPTCPCGKKLELEVMAVHLTKCTQWKN